MRSGRKKKVFKLTFPTYTCLVWAEDEKGVREIVRNWATSKGKIPEYIIEEIVGNNSSCK